MEIRKAVIPAAGFGTRFLPASKSTPKEMFPIIDKPAIQYVVEEAVAAGLTDILFITSDGKNAIESHFDRDQELEQFLKDKGKLRELELVSDIARGATCHYVRQPEQLGLGHAVSFAKQHVGSEPFAVLLGDDIMIDDASLLKRMVKQGTSSGKTVLGLMEVDASEISAYGAASLGTELASDHFEVQDVVEKPPPGSAPSNFAIIGRYVFQPAIFDALEQIQPGSGGELQLTDAIRILAQAGNVVGSTFSEGRVDVGRPDLWLEANLKVAMQRADLRDKIPGIIERATGGDQQ